MFLLQQLFIRKIGEQSPFQCGKVAFRIGSGQGQRAVGTVHDQTASGKHFFRIGQQGFLPGGKGSAGGKIADIDPVKGQVLIDGAVQIKKYGANIQAHGSLLQ